MKRADNIIEKLLLIMVIGLFVARFHAVVVRYFDSDEFAHMHWAYLISKGYLPYKDFFFFIFPFYQWFLLPVFSFAVTDQIIVIRLWQFTLYGATTALIFFLTKHVSNNTISGLLAAIIFLVFPMTFDKTLEVRPDILMTFLFFLSVYSITTIRTGSKWHALLAGVTLGASILTFIKIVFTLPSMIYLIIHSRKKIHIPSFVLGLTLPGILFIGYTLVTGTTYLAYHNIIYGSIAANLSKASFSLWLALSPWPLVYIDRGGMSLPWVVNTALWALTIPSLLFFWFFKRHFAIFFLLFFTFAFVYLRMFPVPYLQYFIPLTVGVSILVGISLWELIQRAGTFLPRKVYLIASLGSFVCLVTVLGVSYWKQYRIRVTASASNAEQLKVIDDIIAISKPDESVYDMVGSYVFRPDGYSICCHPYAEFIDRLSPKPLRLRESLQEKQTKFLLMDRTGLIFWLPRQEDLTFMLTHYLPSRYKKIYTLGFQWQCENGVCFQQDLHNRPISPEGSDRQTFWVFVPERYRIATLPQGGTVMIDGASYADNTVVYLPQGDHTVSAPSPLTSVKIQLDR